MTGGQIGTIIILVLCLILVAAVCVVAIKVRNKVRSIKREIQSISRQAFGTDDIAQGFRNVEREMEVTPKSVSGATSLYLPRIVKDFPDFHYDEMRSRSDALLTAYLNGIDSGTVPLTTEEGITSELKEKYALRIQNLKNHGMTEHFKNIRIHRTEIKQYRKTAGRCSVIFETSIQYYHYKMNGSAVAEGSKDRMEQARYNVEMVYIQDRDLVENASDMGLAMNCPNCGAPLPKLGAKVCAYCESPIAEFQIKVWNFSDVQERK